MGVGDCYLVPLAPDDKERVAAHKRPQPQIRLVVGGVSPGKGAERLFQEELISHAAVLGGAFLRCDLSARCIEPSVSA